MPSLVLSNVYQPILTLNIMVPARPKDPISTVLADVEQAIITRGHLPAHFGKAKCDRMLVEDHYEVDSRFSVEECLSDMMRVLILAQATPENNQQNHKKQDSNK